MGHLHQHLSGLDDCADRRSGDVVGGIFELEGPALAALLNECVAHEHTLGLFRHAIEENG